MKYLINTLIVSIILTLSCVAQKQHYFGIDISKTLTINLFHDASGFGIEPVYIFKPSTSAFKLKASLGYTSIKKDEVYENSDLHTYGFYLKSGVGYSTISYFIPYLNLFITNYTIKNTFEIDGSYFGNYQETYEHNNLYAFGIEPNVDFHILQKKKVSFLISIRANFVLINTEDDYYPVYYIPGAGITNNNDVTGGLTLYILF